VLDSVLRRIERDAKRGHPWSCSLRRRVLITCVALRTNLTVRELAAVFRISKSAAHRIIATMTRRGAALRAAPTRDHRWSWVIDGSLIPTRGPGNRNDVIHYRGSAIEPLCKTHGRVLADGGYRGVPELVTPVFRSNRIIRDRAWRRHRHRRGRVEHAIARLKNWRMLRDHRRRAHHLAATVQAVAALHNLSIDLRDNS
jgi:hypothetical protein